MSEWSFSRDRATHQSGFVAHFTPLPHGTRGKDVAFQDEHGERWIARAEKLPPAMKPMEARKMLRRAGAEWVNWRMRPRYSRW